ncbi:MAG: TolC family protein, partial [Synergistaceae bacterium]
KKAAVGEAESSGLPQVKAGTSYTRSEGSDTDGSSGRYGVSASLEQSVYDWGKRGLKVKGAEITAEAVSMDYLQTRDSVISAVRSAYYGLNRAVREYDVAKTRYDNYQKRLVWAKSYYEVGTKAKIEVTKAQADLASSKLLLVRADSSAAQYRAELASAMGDPLLKISDVPDAIAYEAWSISADEAIKRAESNRPELAAKLKRVEYAKANLALAKKGLTPDITASAGYNFYGTAPFDDNEWNAKLSFNIPIYDGGLTRSKTEGAAADLRTVSAEFASLSNSVKLEVRKAWEALREANEALAASQEAERQQKETLNLAEGRYKAGVGSSLEISDAIESYAAAQTNTVQSLYQCKNAKLALEKAMGGL